MKFSIDQYFAINQELEERNDQELLEFYDGVLIPKKGSEPVFNLDFNFLINFFTTNHEIMASQKHSAIAIKVITELALFVNENEKYEVFDNTFQVFLEKLNAYIYPDITVAESANKIVIKEQLHNPIIAIEILSKSTQKKDKTIKKEAYLACDSMKDYVMIDQYELNIEHYFRTENGWQSEIYTSINDAIAFVGMPFILPLNKIYKKIIDRL